MLPLSLGIVANSHKPDERRLPIHPDHLSRIEPELRARMYLERGYGKLFGATDEQLSGMVAGLLSREELLARCDVVVLPKPVPEDLAHLEAGQVVWGWPHCVQDFELTQVAVDRGLTLIAWEAMNHWTREGNFSVHVFHQNNELAGYCSVLHAMALRGSTSDYGRRLRAVVISFGATARGAVRGLAAMGIHDVTVLTQRDVAAVASPIAFVQMQTFGHDPDHPGHPRVFDESGSGSRPLVEVLAEYDIVVNCILQDTDDPLMFVTEDDLDTFSPGTLFVDVSCDEGMGFSWSRPTSFADPIFEVGNGLHCYAVDHSPSHLWNSATWEISEALLGYLAIVAAGPNAWDGDETIRRAIEIRDGVIVNPRILSFQGRSADPPHTPLRL
ncbi:MAG: N(5)-(carboxyethyl)ornithine synthase [Microlunatus sp.]|nr:N(5)-(carboxyethyl)ornithine synthase [Microlunatus sp.]